MKLSNEDKQLQSSFEAMANVHKHLAQYRTLVLNADGQPMSYYPLSTEPWTQIMFLLVKGEQTGIQRINVLAYYPDVFVNTGRRKIQLPSVVSHRQMIPMPKKVPFTRFNLMLRDDFTCQYSGEKLPERDLTFDHVIPESRGGKTDWLNIVACSRKINEYKADRTPKEAGLKLLREPYEPSVWELREKGRKYPPSYLHETWRDFLYWDSELEQK